MAAITSLFGNTYYLAKANVTSGMILFKEDSSEALVWSKHYFPYETFKHSFQVDHSENYIYTISNTADESTDIEIYEINAADGTLQNSL